MRAPWGVRAAGPSGTEVSRYPGRPSAVAAAGNPEKFILLFLIDFPITSGCYCQEYENNFSLIILNPVKKSIIFFLKFPFSISLFF